MPAPSHTPPQEPPADWRLLSVGLRIPAQSYCDQPCIVRTDDGAWLCCVTTGAGHEGDPGQHVATMRSTDQGRTWSAPVAVESPIMPENSYAVMLKAAGGRVFIFYNHNTDNLREVARCDGLPPLSRVDTLGHYVFKVSDDHGRSWSAKRHPIPVREFECDRANVYGGKVRFFWNVGKPFAHGGAAFVPLHKVGGFGRGFMMRTEGVLLKSANLLTERDPEKIVWETLPDGDAGLRAPRGGGPVAEEQSFCVLSDGSFHAVYRTIDGHPAESCSRDGGHTWSEPRYRAFADGRRMKHPRAANFMWRCKNGRYLYWFNNHGGRFIGEHPRAADVAYNDRNPAWLCGGVEADGPQGRVILWSQPEVLFYDDDPLVRFSYPDLVEEGGRYFVTETQKEIARVHEVPADFVEGLWRSAEAAADLGSPAAVTREGLVLELPEPGKTMPATAAAPELPSFVERDWSRADYGSKPTRRGFTVEAWLTLATTLTDLSLLDTRTPSGQGLAVSATAGGAVEVVLNDGQSESRWRSEAVLRPGTLHHVVAIIDGGPRVISFVIDGRFCDGGVERQFGWGRFSPTLAHARGGAVMRLGGGLARVRVYERAVRVYEAVGNHRAGA